ncbi:MAG: UDP-N-acetylmuramate dehydrogenase [Candidatus Chisholmbacteria bacterium]|nr:UDP-N-acetylmuramate dehydrogenase [Candidatus Chisholmbacteria bacterium]
MKQSYALVKDALSPALVKANEPLSAHTYFKIGGPADLFFEAKTSVDLTKAVKAAIRYDVPYFILGGGANILVGDLGFRGLVVKNRADEIRLKSFQGKIDGQTPRVKQAIVAADSGTLLNKLVRYTIEEGLAGLEVFLSVPGTVGGAIYNNSHYRPEKDEFFGNLVATATLIDSRGKVKEVNHHYFKFNYDYSYLQETKETIVSAAFALKGSDRDDLWKKAVACVRRRNSRQPIGIACSGCTFQNISRSDALRLGTPDHTQSAGYLVDKAGMKGAKVGQAQVSDIHASFIENLGGATAKEVIELIEKIKSAVKNKFGVDLKLEIFVVGEFG